MILLLKMIMITFIIVMGLKITMSEGMVLERLGAYLEKKVDEGNKVFDLFICPWCMPTLQSLTAHLFAFGLGILPLEFDWQLLVRWPLIVMGSSFVCGNAWNIYGAINSVRERNDIQRKHLENVERLSSYDVEERERDRMRKKYN